MPRTNQGFCTVHRIGYDRRLDPTCPQCSVARMAPPEQLDYDVVAQKPVDRSGKLLDPFTMEPVANQ